MGPVDVANTIYSCNKNYKVGDIFDYPHFLNNIILWTRVPLTQRVK